MKQIKESPFLAVSSELQDLAAMRCCRSRQYQQVQKGLGRSRDNRPIKKARQGCALCGICHIRYTAVDAEGVRGEGAAEISQAYTQSPNSTSPHETA